jgi:hypothetical protein
MQRFDVDMLLNPCRKNLLSTGLAGLLALFVSVPATARDDTDCESELTGCEDAESSEVVRSGSLAGPEQVENRLHIDSNQVTPMFPSSFARGYFDWKNRVREDHGVSLGGDYSFGYLKASDSPGANDAFGGMYRFFGSWEATSDGEGNSGALIWKIEHRHAYGSNIPPSALGFEMGYIGLFLPPFCVSRGICRRHRLR